MDNYLISRKIITESFTTNVLPFGTQVLVGGKIKCGVSCSNKVFSFYLMEGHKCHYIAKAESIPALYPKIDRYLAKKIKSDAIIKWQFYLDNWSKYPNYGSLRIALLKFKPKLRDYLCYCSFLSLFYWCKL